MSGCFFYASPIGSLDPKHIAWPCLRQHWTLWYRPHMDSTHCFSDDFWSKCHFSLQTSVWQRVKWSGTLFESITAFFLKDFCCCLPWFLRISALIFAQNLRQFYRKLLALLHKSQDTFTDHPWHFQSKLQTMAAKTLRVCGKNKVVPPG